MNNLTRQHRIDNGRTALSDADITPASTDRSAMRPVEDFWIFDRSQVNVELVSAWLTVTQSGEIEMYARVFAELAGLAVYGGPARSLITAAIDALG
ncbi:hypothetical protein ABT061_24625 [Streptosporangium sp. NPDC002544]|uniref:hypothetical protein n=1 Tax=Streptosporangium sp. NPDC002544 TaxID=3154538 RepID=UPI0033231FC0